jgi:hypothetical protein
MLEVDALCEWCAPCAHLSESVGVMAHRAR